MSEGLCFRRLHFNSLLLPCCLYESQRCLWQHDNEVETQRREQGGSTKRTNVSVCDGRHRRSSRLRWQHNSSALESVHPPPYTKHTHTNYLGIQFIFGRIRYLNSCQPAVKNSKTCVVLSPRKQKDTHLPRWIGVSRFVTTFSFLSTISYHLLIAFSYLE